MSEIFETIRVSFGYSFVIYAVIVGILVALCSSLLGVTLVLKRLSFIGDGLAHVAFGISAVATAASLTNEILIVLPVTVISAILLLRSGRDAKIRGDALIGMISVGTLAVGYLIMNIFAKSSNLAGDVCSTLFGSTSILTLTSTEVWICVILSLAVTAVFVLFYHRIFSVTFDESFTAATGGRVKTYNTVLAVIIAVVIVLAMNLVGSLLISALVVFPAVSAMRVFKSFKSVTICAVAFSVIFAALGLLISIAAGTPVGSTIVAADIAGFAIFYIIGAIGVKGN